VNCYYTNTGCHYSIGYGYKSNIYAENCWFADGVTATKDYTDPKKGYADYNLQLTGCHGQGDMKQQSGTIAYFIPSQYYAYDAFDTSLVPSVVGNEQTGAGATLMVEVGKGVTGYANAPTAIAVAPSAAATACSSHFFSPSGVRLSTPRKGLTIVRQTMTDGSTVTVKIRK
jgi:pectate lyase